MIFGWSLAYPAPRPAIVSAQELTGPLTPPINPANSRVNNSYGDTWLANQQIMLGEHPSSGKLAKQSFQPTKPILNPAHVPNQLGTNGTIRHSSNKSGL